MTKEELTEFQSFLSGKLDPPKELETRIVTRVTRELCPPIPKSVAKLFACNALGSVLTLALCPQYGLSLTGTQGLMPWLMSYHPALCFFSCGILWMLGGQFLANLFLSWDEQRVLSRYYWGVGFGFILFSVLGFACLGSLTLDLWLLLWAAGAFVVAFAFGSRIKLRVKRIRAVALR